MAHQAGNFPSSQPVTLSQPPKDDESVNNVTPKNDGSVVPNAEPVLAHATLTRKFCRKLWLMRKNLETPEAQVQDKPQKSCRACRAKKAKCDQLRPCKRCVDAGHGYKCALEKGGTPRNPEFTDEEMMFVGPALSGAVERPLSRIKLTFTDDGLPLLLRQEGASLPGFLRFMWNTGHRAADLLNMLNAMPPQLLLTTTKIIRAFEILSQLKKAASSPSGSPSHLPALGMGQFRADEPDDLSEILLGAPPGDFQMRIWGNPSDNSRQAFALSPSAQMLFGVHPEQYLAMCANHEVPIFMSEVDIFCTSMWDLLHMGQGSAEKKYLCLKRNVCNPDLPPTPVLVEVTQSIHPTGDKGSIRSQNLMRTFTAEQYEEARQATPHLCRPFSEVMGDHRSAQELCTGHALGQDTFAGRQGTPEGARQLHRLALDLEEVFAPAVAKAESVTGRAVLTMPGMWRPSSLQLVQEELQFGEEGTGSSSEARGIPVGT